MPFHPYKCNTAYYNHLTHKWKFSDSAGIEFCSMPNIIGWLAK